MPVWPTLRHSACVNVMDPSTAPQGGRRRALRMRVAARREEASGAVRNAHDVDEARGLAGDVLVGAEERAEIRVVNGGDVGADPRDRGWLHRRQREPTRSTPSHRLASRGAQARGWTAGGVMRSGSAVPSTRVEQATEAADAAVTSSRKNGRIGGGCATTMPCASALIYMASMRSVPRRRERGRAARDTAVKGRAPRGHAD